MNEVFMVTAFQELQMYKNFDELASDVLDLVKEILPGHLIYLTSHNDGQQVILKLSNEDTSIVVTEGTVLNLNETLCYRVDFQKNAPLVYEDVKKENELADFQNRLEELNIHSYLGLPISFENGEKFGTLCAVNDEVSHFDKKSIQLLQKIVRMFSYYLNLERFAFRDSLTDLYNRRYLSKYFEDHSNEGGAILFLDLDGFKKVNDVYGHEEGDLVLKEIAAKLQKFVASIPDAFAVRLGGDEFVVHFSALSSKAEISKQAELLIESLREWRGGYELTASMGIVAYPANCLDDLKTLLAHADQALYCAKTAGKNTYKFF
jgi:diguanylate cyclase